ncbi:MAG TPA: BMC domain-containing protein [Clostridia bacterium]|nr:BMC domain-containing protein [Clostridia bacterium]
MNGQALGLIETVGYIGAVEAADVCLKAANVRLIGVQLVKGGLVMVAVTGDVGAVKAAVAASRTAVEKVGQVIAVHVIPRPAEDIQRLLEGSGKCSNAAFIEAAEKAEAESGLEADSFTESGFSEKLNSMKVVELRVLARQLPGINLERGHIKYANRKELLEAILEYHERKS